MKKILVGVLVGILLAPVAAFGATHLVRSHVDREGDCPAKTIRPHFGGAVFERLINRPLLRGNMRGETAGSSASIAGSAFRWGIVGPIGCETLG